MVKKIFTKTILASTLFFGGILGAIAISGVNPLNNNSIANKNINVKRSDESSFEQLSYTMTFLAFDKGSNIYKYVLSPELFNGSNNLITVYFSNVTNFYPEDGSIQLGRGAITTFTPVDGIEIDKITISGTGGALGLSGNSSVKNVDTSNSSRNNPVVLVPKDKSKEVKITNGTQQFSYASSIVIDYHFASYSQKSDADNHWQECVCGTKKDVTAHTWDNKEFVTSPSHEHAGETKYTCVCGETKIETTNPSIEDELTDIKLVNSLTYNGNEQTQEVEVTYNGVKLEENTHYTVTNNVQTNPGTYELTITGKDLFEGTKTIEYKVAKRPIEFDYNEDLEPTIEELQIGETIPNYVSFGENGVTSGILMPSESIASKVGFELGILVYETTNSSVVDGHYLAPETASTVDGYAYVVTIVYSMPESGLTINENFEPVGIPEDYSYEIIMNPDNPNASHIIIYKYLGVIEEKEYIEFTYDKNYEPTIEELALGNQVPEYVNFEEWKGFILPAENSASKIDGNISIAVYDSRNPENILSGTILQPGATIEKTGHAFAVAAFRPWGSTVFSEDMIIAGVPEDYTLDIVVNSENPENSYLVIYKYLGEIKKIPLKLDYNEDLEPTIEELQIGETIPNFMTFVDNNIMSEITSGIFMPEASFVGKINVVSGIVVHETTTPESMLFDGASLIPGTTSTVSGHAFVGILIDSIPESGFVINRNMELIGVPEGYTIEFVINSDNPNFSHIILYKYLGVIEEKGYIEFNYDNDYEPTIEELALGNQVPQYVDYEAFKGFILPASNSESKIDGNNSIALYDSENPENILSGKILQPGETIEETGHAFAVAAFRPWGSTVFSEDMIIAGVPEDYTIDIVVNSENPENSYIVIYKYLGEINYDFINQVDVSVSQDFINSYLALENISEELSDAVVINEQNAKYVTGIVDLKYLNPSTNELEFVNLEEPLSVNYTYYFVVCLITGDESNVEEFNNYRFASDVKNKTEGWIVNPVWADDKGNLTVIELAIKLPSLKLEDIAQAEISLGEQLTYNGQAQTQEIVVKYKDDTLVKGTDYTITGNVNTNAGTYELTVTGIGSYEGSVKVEYVIAKATYDMSGVKLENKTVTYNGSEHVVVITGKLPSGVTVSYENNEKTNAGTYKVVAEFEGNENYNSIPDMEATLTINKATYDMSGVKLENKTVTYDGNEHEVVLGGTLPSGVEVTYTTNKGTNAGTYNAVATFTYDTANYNVIENKTATLTINKAKATITVDTDDINVIYGNTITLPDGTANFGEVVVTKVEMINAGEYKVTYSVASTNNYDGDTREVKVIISPLAVSEPTLKGTYTYTGNEQTVELNNLESFMTIVSGNKQTNAGNYEVVITLDTNHVWKEGSDGKIAWSIAKATYDLSDISFNNKTVVENGENQSLTITGTLPNGVTVTYSLTECVEPGVYEITASFTGDYNNYNVIDDMSATLVIKQTVLEPETNLGEGHENNVVVTSPEGIDPNKQLVVELVEIVDEEKDYSQYLKNNQKVAIAYDIKLLDENGIEVQPDGTLIIKILIPESLRGREFDIMHIHEGKDKTMMEYTTEGDYVVIHVDELSEFVFVYERISLLWLIIVLSVIALLDITLFVVLRNRRKQKKETKLASFSPLFLASIFISEIELAIIIVLSVVIIAFTAINVIYALLLTKNKEKELDSEVVEEDEKVEDANETLDEDDQISDNEKGFKKFTEKLEESSDEVKNYYDIIKNELLSYSKVKSKISYKHEMFRVGKEIIARVKFRGKTLCLYLALNPSDYENSKYKVEDMSSYSSSASLPTMYRVNLPRRAKYALDLISDLMKKLDTEKNQSELANNL